MMKRKAVLTILAGATALVSTAANAADMCTTLKTIIAVAKRDPNFSSQQTTPFVMGGKGVLARSQVPGFTCKVSIEQGRGFWACMKENSSLGTDEADALSYQIEDCLNVAPTKDNGDYSVDYTFNLRRNPKLMVYLSGSKGKLVFLNVITN
jgi:hypothetical protein